MSDESEQTSHIRWDKVKDIQQASAGARRAVTEKMEKWANKIVVGAKPKSHYSDRAEGDMWQDADGKSWTKKDGVIQSISNTQRAKTPWWCPKCEQPMNHWLHDKFWMLRGMCHRCVVAEEHVMRMNGTWEAYERKMVRNNERSILRDKILEHETYIKEFKEPTVYFENGGYQVLAKKQEFEFMFDQLRADIAFMKQKIEQLDAEEKLDETPHETVS